MMAVYHGNFILTIFIVTCQLHSIYGLLDTETKLIDAIVQYVWDPSALVRVWTALDQFYQLASSYKEVAIKLLTLPDRDPMQHTVQFNGRERALGRIKRDPISFHKHLDRIAKTYQSEATDNLQHVQTVKKIRGNLLSDEIYTNHLGHKNHVNLLANKFRPNLLDNKHSHFNLLSAPSNFHGHRVPNYAPPPHHFQLYPSYSTITNVMNLPQPPSLSILSQLPLLSQSPPRLSPLSLFPQHTLLSPLSQQPLLSSSPPFIPGQYPQHQIAYQHHYPHYQMPERYAQQKLTENPPASSFGMDMKNFFLNPSFTQPQVKLKMFLKLLNQLNPELNHNSNNNNNVVEPEMNS